MSVEFYLIAVAVITTVSASRLTRLATWDEFPPVRAARYKYAEWTDKTDRRRGWGLLAFCGYCASFWLTALVVGWGLLAGVYNGYDDSLSEDIWLIANSTLAGSYLAAILMAHDGDDGDED